MVISPKRCNYFGQVQHNVYVPKTGRAQDVLDQIKKQHNLPDDAEYRILEMQSSMSRITREVNFIYCNTTLIFVVTSRNSRYTII